MAAIVELKNTSKIYRMGKVEVHALRDVSLSIESGEFVAIMGPSGSGKSTLLHILGFLDRPDAGEYIISGRNISNLSDDELAALRNRLVGFVFQQFHLLKRVSALENVKLPFIYGKDAKNIRSAAYDRICSVGLEDRASHWPNELSGGQQQRVAIARALVKDPLIIFADEPTGNLDSVSEHEIMHILKDLNAKGKTIIMVTHEQEISEYAGRVITMRDGKIVSDEKTRSKLESEKAVYDLDKIISGKRSVWQGGELFGHFHQAVKSVLSNKVRSFLSMLGILVGVASVIAMLALGEGATSSMQEGLKSLGSNLLSVRAGSAKVHGAASGTGAITRFTFDDVEAIRDVKPDVRKISGIISGSVQLVYKNENWNTRIEGVGLDYAEMRASVPETGRWFTEEEIRKREKVAVIGITVLEKLFADENPINKTIKINRINFRIIGIAPQKGFGGFRDQDDIVYIPVTTAMYRVLGKDYLEGIYVEVSEQDVMDETQKKIEEIIKKRHRLYEDEDSFNIRNMSEIQDMISSTTKTMSLLLGCIAAISLLVGGIGIMNIMLVSVTERTREIGLRKAIGARRADVMMQFLIEAIVMSLTGGLLGIIVGTGTAFLLSLFAGWTTKVSIYSVVLATTFSVVVGVGFGLWPAKRAAELNAVDALRYE